MSKYPPADRPIRAGAFAAAQLIHAVQVVAAGDALLAPSVTRRLIADFTRQPPARPPSPAALDTLTSRETEVLKLIGQGLSNAGISPALCIAGETTKTYVKRILAKLALRDRAYARCMTGDPPDDGRTVNPPHLDRPSAELASDESETSGRECYQPAPEPLWPPQVPGPWEPQQPPQQPPTWHGQPPAPFPAPGQAPIEMMLAFAAGNFCAAFIQALGQRAGNRVANLPKQVSDLVRKRVKRKGRPEEIHISAKRGATATIAVTADTPDEARLALLDLDVTAEELRGNLLRWDPAASAWLPAGSASARRHWPWRRSAPRHP